MNAISCQLNAILDLFVKDARMGDIPTGDLRVLSIKLRAMADALDWEREKINPAQCQYIDGGAA